LNKNNELSGYHNAKRSVLTSGDLSVSIINQQVYLQDKLLMLPNLSYLLLVDLMMHWPQTRTQDELIQSIWGKVQVQNSTLNQRVKLLRQAFKEQGGDPKVISLVRGVGYRFAEDVKIVEENLIAKKQKPFVEKAEVIKTIHPSGIIKKSAFKIITALIVALTVSSTLLQWTTKREGNKGKHSLSIDKQRQSITVAPFISNSYANTSDDYLANSFRAEISSSLADVSDFQVITHNSSIRNQKTALTNQEIGQKLDADIVLTGKINRVENGFNVDIQLVSTNTNETIWAQNYHASQNNLYFLKFDIAQEIQAYLFPNNIRPLSYHADPSFVNPKAYDFYLKAMDYHRRNSKSANLHAQTLVERAYELSPSCLDIISGYASILNRGITLGEKADTSLTKAVSLANKAIELYPNNFRGYVELANSMLLQQDDKMALNYFKQALLLSPENVSGLIGLSTIQIKTRKFKEALANTELLKTLDPSSTHSLLLSGDAYSALALYTQAQQYYDSIIKIEPDSIDAFIGLARLNIKQGYFDKAEKHYQSIYKISPDSPKSFHILVEILFSQKHYLQLITQVELHQEHYKNSIYTDKIEELSALADLLVNSVKNTSAIAQKINDYQTEILDDGLSADKFTYLFALLEVVEAIEEHKYWKNIESKFIADAQRSIL